MRIIDDIDALHALIKQPEKSQKILTEQLNLLNQHIPFAFLGAIIPSILFFIMMYFTLDLKFGQKIINIFWITYLVSSLLFSWNWWYKINKYPSYYTLKRIKMFFISYSALLIFLGSISSVAFIVLWYKYSQLTIEILLSFIFIFFQCIALYLCWYSWCKIKSINRLNSLVVDSQSGIYTLSDEEKTLTTDDTESNNKYLINYFTYRLLLICTFTVGSLWGLAICKVVLTNIQDSTQVITMLGIHFGILGGAISSVGVFWRIYIMLALPSMLAWIFTLFFLNEPRLIVLALAILLLLVFTIIFSRHTWLYTLKTILVYMENKKLVEQLRSKTKQVEQASIAKTQFLATASHDLRQPVQALSLFIETLSNTELTEHQAKIVEYASTASKSSRDMLNSILDHAHLESGTMKPNIVTTELNHIITSLIDEFSMQAQSKKLTLRYRTTDIKVRTDPSMLSSILRNFLSNALRYTSKGGVLIGVREIPNNNSVIHQKLCRVSVWDTGSGMTTDEIEQIFISFHQLERNNKKNQGLGLGLSIAQGMATLLGTSINVKSDLNRGSEFYVDLPIIDELYSENLETSCMNSNSFSHLTILVVDDEKCVLTSMQLLLSSWGCKVVTAYDVNEALLLASTEQPNIVITDFRLADNETGEDVINAIQNQISLTIEFLVLTGDTSPELVNTELNKRIRILHKPIDPETLKMMLHKIAATI